MVIFSSCLYQLINGKTFQWILLWDYWFQPFSKGKSYDSILVIVDWLTQMVNYKPIKDTIYTPGLTEVILDMVI